MTTRVSYTAQTGPGREVALFVNEVQSVLAKGRRLKAKLDSMCSGDDWARIEAEIGGMAQGSGQTLWAIVATAMAQIDAAQVAELARLDQGIGA